MRLHLIYVSTLIFVKNFRLNTKWRKLKESDEKYLEVDP